MHNLQQSQRLGPLREIPDAQVDLREARERHQSQDPPEHDEPEQRRHEVVYYQVLRLGRAGLQRARRPRGRDGRLRVAGVHGEGAGIAFRNGGNGRKEGGRVRVVVGRMRCWWIQQVSSQNYCQRR